MHSGGGQFFMELAKSCPLMVPHGTLSLKIFSLEFVIILLLCMLPCIMRAHLYDICNVKNSKVPGVLHQPD